MAAGKHNLNRSAIAEADSGAVSSSSMSGTVDSSMKLLQLITLPHALAASAEAANPCTGSAAHM